MDEGYDDTKYGECRCCLATGNHRDLMKEYEWNGTREMYFKLFLDCFNVFLSTDKSNLICTSCVMRLRDANSFKRMVIEKQRNLFSCSIKEDAANEHTSSVLEVNIKIEPTETNYTDKDRNFDDDSLSEIEEADNVEPKNPKVLPTSCQLKRNNRLEKLAYIHNTSLIIENSNVTPFKLKYQRWYCCFYCSVSFQDICKMRVHQQNHTKNELRTVLNTQGAEAFIVYVDVTDLKCTICNEEIPSLAELKSHLVKKHNKEMQDYPDRVIPFKLSTKVFECQVCKCIFETFGAMDRHMNVHFRNDVCNECGTGFATKSRLKKHSQQHIQGSYQCEICKKIYTTALKLKYHVTNVHKMVKRHKCLKCEERFSEYFQRHKHMETVHGVAKREYKCNVCDRIFSRKTRVAMHMKRSHLDERDYQCEMCLYRCFTKASLKVHMIKHNGEQIHECVVCKKSYARKRTLIEHMRIHNNDRRYVCKVCGQAFVQNCSLKGHIKKHHPEFQII